MAGIGYVGVIAARRQVGRVGDLHALGDVLELAPAEEEAVDLGLGVGDVLLQLLGMLEGVGGVSRPAMPMRWRASWWWYSKVCRRFSSSVRRSRSQAGRRRALRAALRVLAPVWAVIG